MTSKFVTFILTATIVFIGLLSGQKAGLLLMFISIISCLFLFFSKSYILKKTPKEIKLYFVIVIMSIISSLFALNINLSLDLLWKIIAGYFIFMYCFNYVRNKNNFYYLIHSYLFSTFSLAFYNAVNYQLTIFRELPYGGVNPVALIMFSSIILVFLLIMLTKVKAYLFLIPLYLYVLFLTQSQKSILSLLIVLFVFVILILLNKKITSFIKIMGFGLLFIFSTYYFLKEFDLLSGGAQRTFATVESIYTGEKVYGAAGGTQEGGLRTKLKNKGWQYFLDKPFLGYGLNNFRTLYGKETGLYTYSHFTPIELAIAYGFIGVVIYYLIYFLLLRNLFFKFLKFKNNIYAYSFSILIALIVIGFYMQTYIDPTVNFMLVIIIILSKKTQLLTNEYK